MYRAALDFLREPFDLALSPYHAAMAIARQRGWRPGPEAPSSPEMPPAALSKWRDEISRARTYLEFGAGGSTIEAARTVKNLVTVETDKAFLDVVASKVDGPANFYPLHVDIGMTRDWGRPVMTIRTKARLTKWRRYASAPWDMMERLGIVPDLILVDGRFRVASVLESMLRLPEESDALFLMDDFYGKRGRLYAVVNDFAAGATRHDRMIAFRRPKDIDRARCAALLDTYRGDPR